MKTYDNHGELIQDLITLYQNALDEAPEYNIEPTTYVQQEEECEKYHEFLLSKEMTAGICKAAFENLNINIYSSDFIRDFVSGRLFYCATPSEIYCLGSSCALIEQSIVNRINRLKELLPVWKDKPVIYSILSDNKQSIAIY